VSSQVNEILSEIDVEKLKEMIASNPANYPKIAKIVTAQSNERTKRQKLELEFQRYQDRVNEQKRKIEAELNKVRDGGLAPETISKIEEALNLLVKQRAQSQFQARDVAGVIFCTFTHRSGNLKGSRTACIPVKALRSPPEL
jgi:lipid II:glycine glycyltransferase (peptidoglycan interpeptide bridge formation enzyme)